MLYFNLECGNILTYDEMVEEAKELYDVDLNDPTNLIGYEEYYIEYIEDEYDEPDLDLGFNPYMGCYDYDC